MICSFTGKTFQEIVEKTTAGKTIDIEALNGITDYINKNYRQCVKEAIARSGHEYEDKKSESSSHALVAAGAATLGLTALAIVSGLALFNMQASGQSEQPRHDGRRRHHP